jgi:hypothetical protein
LGKHDVHTHLAQIGAELVPLGAGHGLNGVFAVGTFAAQISDVDDAARAVGVRRDHDAHLLP